MIDMKTTWDLGVKEKLDIFVSKMPIFHRRIAEQLISDEAKSIVGKRGSSVINEEDLLRAMFSSVPSPFFTVMLRLLDDLKLDYKKYGLPNR